MTTSPLYDRVRAALKTKLVTQKRVAKESGVPLSTVARIAQGITTNPTINTLQALADYFDSIDSAPPCSPGFPLADKRHPERVA